MPDVPTGFELGYQTLSAATLYRAVYAPPKTPDKITDILSIALAKALQDRRVIDWAKKADRQVGPVMTNKELKAAIDEIIVAYGKYKELFK